MFSLTKVSSNRTFMELKCGKAAMAAAENYGSNRTFMELKFIFNDFANIKYFKF